MKKILLILFLLVFSAQITFSADAILKPDKTYIVVSLFPINSLKVGNENILTTQLMTSIFGDKNQIVLKTKNIGQTNIYCNNKTYQFVVSKEQKEQWNIPDVTCAEIDNPPVVKVEME